MSQLHPLLTSPSGLCTGIAPKPLEWTDHQVDGCPVPTSAFVDVRYRDGDFSLCVAAGGLPWSKTGTYCDIVAFRIVPPPNVKSAAADDIKAAYFEGFLAGCDQGERTGQRYAEKNWPFSQAQSDHERTLMEASVVAEAADHKKPVAWQTRMKPAGAKRWGDWHFGRMTADRAGWDVEERPLYAGETWNEASHDD